MDLIERLEVQGGAGVRLEAGQHGAAENLSLGNLLNLAALAADVFRDAGLQPGDRVITVLPTGRSLLQSILGAWHAGGTICVLAPTIDLGRSSLSSERLRAMLSGIAPKLLVGARDDNGYLRSIAEAVGARFISSTILPAAGLAKTRRYANTASDRAFIQFTSGSTGAPKPVVIKHGQLLCNVDESAQRVEFDSTSTMVSWLPLHHDLGFVTGLMMSLASSARLIQIPTETFLSNPTIWLAKVAEFRATHSLAPPFACRLLSKPIYARRLADADLSSLRYVGLGAEPVSWLSIREFEETYASHGLRPGATRTAFGLAEATLAVTGSAPFAPRRLTWINSQLYRQTGKVILADPRSATATPLVSNGPPIPSVHVKIVDLEGLELPSGQQGRVLISGACVTQEYFGSDDDPQSDGWLDTGDLGFVLHNELYISGRAKDVIIRGGINIHAHEIEQLITDTFSDVALRAVAFSLPRADDFRDEIVIGIELRRLPGPHDLAVNVSKTLVRELGLQIDQVLSLPKGAIPRTTSGKLQRSRARDLYRTGELVPRTSRVSNG